MACNFLIKKATDEKYTHFFIEGCSGATAQNAVLKFFMEKNPDVKVNNFGDRPGCTCIRFWVKYLQGVSILEELYEITVGKTQMYVNPTLGNTPGNLMEGTSMKPTLIDQKPAVLLDYFKNDV